MRGLRQGLMMMPAAAVPAGRQGAALVRRLWVHETLRVFQDRLVSDGDREWLLEQASTARGPPRRPCIAECKWLPAVIRARPAVGLTCGLPPRQARDSLRAHLGADLDELMRPVVAAPRARAAPGAGLGLALAQAPEQPERVGCDAMRQCIFGAYMQPDLRPADRTYTEVADAPALLSRLEAYMADHDGA